MLGTTLRYRRRVDSFPHLAKKMTLFVSKRADHSRARTQPVQSFAKILVLSNIAYMQKNHIHHFLQNIKERQGHRDTDGFLCSHQDRVFHSRCPRSTGSIQTVLLRTTVALQIRGSSLKGVGQSCKYSHADATRNYQHNTCFLDKDIQSVTELKFTHPRDFYKRARFLEDMAGISQLLFGPSGSLLTDMLYKWNQFLTISVHGANARNAPPTCN